MMSAEDLATLKGEVEGLKLALAKKEKEAEATAENFNKQLASFKNNTCTLSAEPYPLAFKEEVWGYTSKTHVGKDPENFRSRAST